MADDLNTLHLADLHERAQRLGVPRFRLLDRDALIAAIGSVADEEGDGGGVEGSGSDSAEQPPRRRSRRGSRGGRGRGGRGRGGGRGQGEGEGRRTQAPRGADSDDEPDDAAAADQDGDVETEDVTGVLDRMPQGYGFLRLADAAADEGDVYVSASQIRRCELRAGDEIAGPARSPRRGERHRALVRVATVNGEEPGAGSAKFEDLTAVAPTRRLPLGEGSDVLTRSVDLLAPLAFGQRILVLAEPRSGRTTLLRAIAQALSSTEADVMVLLADERPEEVTAWEQAVPDAEIVAAPADQEPTEQVHAAELAIGQAKRKAESGADVVVILDSLSRLALGYRDPSRVKRLFGSGRDLSEEGSGSLTMIATVLDSDDQGAGVREAIETTENALIRLDAGLAAQGIVPALMVAECRVSGENDLRSADELNAVRELRAELDELNPEDAALALASRIKDSISNTDLLRA